MPPCSVDQFLRERDHVLRLRAEEADGLDEVAHLGLAELHHLLRRVGGGEQRGRRLVDAGVGRLRRQHHRDQQRVGILVLELGLRVRHRGLQSPERLLDLGRRPRAASRRRRPCWSAATRFRGPLTAAALPLRALARLFRTDLRGAICEVFSAPSLPYIERHDARQRPRSRTHDLFGGADPASLAVARPGS